MVGGGANVLFGLRISARGAPPPKVLSLDPSPVCRRLCPVRVVVPSVSIAYSRILNVPYGAYWRIVVVVPTFPWAQPIRRNCEQELGTRCFKQRRSWDTVGT
jgi:hypothetical protein